MADTPTKLTVTIDGKTIQVDPGTLVWQAAQQGNISVPIYCYHPKMKPLGACRICLVQIEGQPRLATSCTTAVADNMIVHTRNEVVTKARQGVMEFLLINHPLDCPICDRGGECDLQDFAVAYGRGKSRFVEQKMHKAKAIDLGPRIVLDRERCILCQRCVRFCEEVVEEGGLIMSDRGVEMEIATFRGEAYDSQFSGNTVEMCPVGALTSKSYRFRSRPWELTAASSVCPHCPVGCNIKVDARLGLEVVRFRGRDNDAVNDGFLCDTGRYGFEFINSPDRLASPLLRKDGELQPVSWDEALQAVAEGFAAALGQHGPQSIGGVGSGYLGNEDAYAFQHFMREVLGSNNVDHYAHSSFADPVQHPDLFTASFNDMDKAQAILLIGADVSKTLPIMELRLKKARREGAKIVLLNPTATALDPFAAAILGYEPLTLAEVLDNLAAEVQAARTEGATPTDDARILANAANIVVWYDETTALGQEDARSVIAALSRLLATLQTHTCGPLVASSGNVLGVRDMGLLPSHLPGYQPATTPGLGYAQMLVGGLQALYVIGDDPARRDPTTIASLQALPFLVVQDQFLTETGRLAQVVLPASSFAEKAGTVTNTERRVQRRRAAVGPVANSRTELDIFADLAGRLGKTPFTRDYAAAFKQIAAAVPQYASLTLAKLGSKGALWQARAAEQAATSDEVALLMAAAQA